GGRTARTRPDRLRSRPARPLAPPSSSLSKALRRSGPERYVGTRASGLALCRFSRSHTASLAFRPKEDPPVPGALRAYRGGLVAVTHDRRFVEHVDVAR